VTGSSIGSDAAEALHRDLDEPLDLHVVTQIGRHHRQFSRTGSCFRTCGASSQRAIVERRRWSGSPDAMGVGVHRLSRVLLERHASGQEREGGSRQLVLLALPYVVYLVGAVVVLHNLWADPGGVMVRDNYGDQVQFEWFLTNGANAVAHGENPLFTTKLNAPYGVNLMANTSMLALALTLAPVTLIFGADATFVVVDTLALAGTASAWLFVLHRLLNHRVAAVIGGAFCGFAPAMISHANGHPNIAAQFVLPFIVLVVLRLGRPGGWHVRRGLVLAGLVVVQAFINEELLLFTALALGVFLSAYAVSRSREVGLRVRGALRSLATTTLAAGAALAYPLYHQFFGRGAYHGLPEDVVLYGTDLASYWSFARRSLGGDLRIVGALAQNPTEENSFFGFPLLLALAVVVVWLRRDAVVRALTVTGLVFAALSLGARPRLAGADLQVPMPWGVLDGLPLFDSVVPTRLALIVTPVVGCLLAIAVLQYDRLVTDREPVDADGRAGKVDTEPVETADAMPIRPGVLRRSAGHAGGGAAGAGHDARPADPDPAAGIRAPTCADILQHGRLP